MRPPLVPVGACPLVEFGAALFCLPMEVISQPSIYGHRRCGGDPGLRCLGRPDVDRNERASYSFFFVERSSVHIILLR